MESSTKESHITQLAAKWNSDGCSLPASLCVLCALWSRVGKRIGQVQHHLFPIISSPGAHGFSEHDSAVLYGFV